MEESKQQKKERAINIQLYQFPEENFIDHQSEDGKCRLHTYRWPGALTLKGVPPKAVLLFYHGYASNCAANAYIAKLYAEENYDFVGYDQKGFGKSEGVRGLIDDKETFYQNCTNFVLKTRKFYSMLYPKMVIPFISIGYSLGAQLIVGSSRQLKDLKLPGYDSIILIVPGFRAILDHWTEEEHKQVADLSAENALNLVPFHAFKPITDISYLAVYPDPLFFYMQPYARSLHTFKEISDKDYEHFKDISCPVYVTFAFEDQNADERATRKFLEAIATPKDQIAEKTFKSDHPILSDGWVYEEVIQSQVEWLDSIIPTISKEAK